MAKAAEVEYEVFSTFGSGRYVNTQVRQAEMTENYIYTIPRNYGHRFTVDGKSAPLKKDMGGNYRYRLLRYRLANKDWVTVAEPSASAVAVPRATEGRAPLNDVVGGGSGREGYDADD